MSNLISEYLNEFSFLSIKDIKFIFSAFHVKKVEKGDVLITSGQYFPYILKVRKGLLRTYAITLNGDDKTLFFSDKGDDAGSLESIFMEQPSGHFIEALENSVLIVVDAKKFQSLAKKKTMLLKMMNKNLIKGMTTVIERLKFHTLLSPEQRYCQLLENQPTLIQRVPQKHIASYIGVTTVSMSRIKARVYRKKS
jgi:CRP-like cAMP-binding protein